MEIFKIYSGGKFIATDNELDVLNPFTNKSFARTFKAGKEELNSAIEKALSVEKEMRELPVHKRYKILMQIAAGIKESREKYAVLLSMESGKPIRYAFAEIDRAIQTFTVAAEESKRLPAEYISLDWTPAATGKEGLVKYFPVGPVAGITPFNFPLNLAVHKIAPAIASGCPIIIKPASPTPLSCLELAKIVDETSLPKGAFSVLPMDRETGNQLVTDERFKLLSFTGSPDVGWKMKAQAGKKKTVLELGGNAAVIITASADLETALSKNIAGGFAYSGQVCIHVQRIFVHEQVFKQFADRFLEGVKGLKYGDPLSPATDISVMIDEPNAIRVEAWVNEAVDGGASVLCGGKRSGSFYEPTVISNTDPGMKVACREVFGPVVIIEPYSDFSDAVNRVNGSVYGLQAGVFTNEIKEMDFAFNNLDVGGVILNDVPAFRADHMPYGGNKDSGLGREGVKYAIRDMLESRILVKPVFR